jgi:hypothetical protein
MSKLLVFVSLSLVALLGFALVFYSQEKHYGVAGEHQPFPAYYACLLRRCQPYMNCRGDAVCEQDKTNLNACWESKPACASALDRKVQVKTKFYFTTNYL